MRIAAVAFAFVCLAACASDQAPATSADAVAQTAPGSKDAAEQPAPRMTDASAEPAPASTDPIAQPEPAEVVDSIAQPATGEVVRSCSADADCAVKNVGSCCGYYPACVNKDSPTFPERVKADCAAKDMSSVCGFQEPAGCACVEGVCASTGTSLSPGELK